MEHNLIVFGAGGHADSCQQVISEFGPITTIFLKQGDTCHIQGDYFIAIGDNRIRKEIAEANTNLLYRSFLSKWAFGFPKEMGKGTIIMPGAIIREGVCVGDFSIINSGAIIEHGVEIGSYVHVAPGAIVLGDCRICDGTFIGANATIRQGITVGSWQFVKAGSVVKENLIDQDMRSGDQD